MQGEVASSGRSSVDKRLTTVAWVLFFAMWGLTLLVERSLGVSLQNYQYVAAGLILLGLNAARYLKGIPMSRLTVVVGFLAVAGGALTQYQGEFSVVGMLLVTLGSVLLSEGVLRLQRREPPAQVEPRRRKPRRHHG